MLYESKFLLSLFFTLLIEIPVLFLLLKYFLSTKKEITNKNILVVGIIASTLSQPYLWFVLSPYINSRYYLYTGELIVIVIEAIILNQLLNLSIKHSLIMSFVMNIISFSLGLLIFY